MFKRFLALVMVLCMVALCCALPVNAASLYWEEDFSDGLPSFSYTLNPTSGSYSCDVEDGALIFDNMNGGSNLARAVDWTGTYDGEGDLFIQFDIKWDDWTVLTNDTRFFIYVYAGGGRRVTHSICPHQYWFNNGSNTARVADDTMMDKEWYTFIYRFKQNKQLVDVYRKKTNSDEAPVALVTNYATQGTDGFQRINMFKFKGMKASVDNFRVYSGTFLNDSEFIMDGTKIDAVNEVVSGTLTAKAEVVDSSLFGTEMSVETLLMAFDESGMMVDCLFGGSRDMTAGKNIIEAEFDTAGFSDKVQSGQLKFCIWKDLMSARPVVEPAVLGE